jgi:hypothetical protein
MRAWRWKTLLTAALILFAARGALAQEMKLLPSDEAKDDLSWSRFKASLLAASQRHDQKWLLRVVDPRIRNTSGTSGVTEFKKVWELDASDSPLWVELPKILFLGGAFVKRDKGRTEYCAPYVYYKWPDNAPAYASGAITAKDVLLKARASAAAETVRTLSYELVNVLNWEVADENPETKQLWVMINTAGGRGYVPAEQIRSPLEHRACFIKSAQGWRLTAIEAGE